MTELLGMEDGVALDSIDAVPVVVLGGCSCWEVFFVVA
jgi:hypothetical protein